MARIFHIGEPEEYKYNQRGYDEELLEKAFKEGYEYGYCKAMQSMEGFNERRGRVHFKEGLESMIERLKEKYK